MLLQTNSYVVPKDKRSEHARLLRKFRQTLSRLGCDHFEVYEQVGANWSNGEKTGRFVQIMRFRDRKHQIAVQSAERNDPVAQKLIEEFCQLINFPYQQQQGLFAVGFYTSALPVAPTRAGAPGEAGSAADAAATGEEQPQQGEMLQDPGVEADEGPAETDEAAPAADADIAEDADLDARSYDNGERTINGEEGRQPDESLSRDDLSDDFGIAGAEDAQATTEDEDERLARRDRPEQP